VQASSSSSSHNGAWWHDWLNRHATGELAAAEIDHYLDQWRQHFELGVPAFVDTRALASS